jgi:predicted dehydrogenase
MALDMTPEQRAVGKANFQRVVGKLAQQPAQGMTRRRFMQGMIAAGATVPVAAAAYFGYTNSSFSNNPVRAGLIGAGDEGGVLVGEHNPAYIRFVAYSDIRPSNQKRIFEMEPAPSPRRGFKFHYGNNAAQNIRLYENYNELLRDPQIEMVVIALPLHLHAPVAIAAMKAGKHVLCEKLMAWNIKQCKEMIRVAKEQNVLLAIGHQRHYSMLYTHATEVIKSGVLGDITHIRALWHRNNAKPLLKDGRHETEVVNGRTVPRYRDSWRRAFAPADEQFFRGKDLRPYGFKDLNELVRWRLYRRTGGGLMAELGSHQLDACSIFLGKTRTNHVHPIAVTAIGGKNFYQDDREIEDQVFCTFEFPGTNYDPRQPRLDSHGNQNYRNLITVTYSSISTNDFESYGECVMGSKATMVVEKEQNVMLWGISGRSTNVTVTTNQRGQPALDSSASTDAPAERQATDTGLNTLGHAPPSRGYREEMEHFAYCVRMRNQGMERDRENLQPRCDGRAAMDDAIIALTANLAIRRQQRIEFKESWFDPNSTDVPDLEMTAEGPLPA